MMKHQLVRDILLDTAEMDAPFAMKGVECSCFSHGCVAVNHCSTPVSIPFEGIWHGTQESSPGILPGHSAVFIEREEKP